MKRKWDLTLFELPEELKEKKQRLGPVARVKVFGGCLTSNEVEGAFKAQTAERHEVTPEALAKQLAVAMGKDITELHTIPPPFFFPERGGGGINKGGHDSSFQVGGRWLRVFSKNEKKTGEALFGCIPSRAHIF